MGENNEISVEIACWVINMFCIVPCVLSYMCMVLCLYSLIEFNLCKTHKQFDNIKIISRVCVTNDKVELLGLINILARARNGIAHCNYNSMERSAALQRIVQSLSIQDFEKSFIFLIGENCQFINIDKLYINLCSYQLSWNPPLGSSKEVFEDYSRKMIELEEEIYKRRNSNEENKFS